MSLKIILRFILAISFAVVAVIFSELIPPINGVNPFIVKTLFTILAALLGFVIFPDVAGYLTKLTISLFNLTVVRISSEILNQLLRLPKHHPLASTPIFSGQTSQIGNVTLTKPLLLDTSAIIDGRILDIGRTGFLNGILLIPSFVLLELQQVADSSDGLKRARGRRGFEVIESLKKTPGIKIEVWDKDSGGKSVDEKLLKLAKSLHGKIITTDFNLNRLSVAHGVVVLNVNELSNAVKTVSLPGETMSIKIIHIGKDSAQGVGYLADGTMVVVEDGAPFLGKEIKAEVSRVLQGSAGRMIFARKTAT